MPSGGYGLHEGDRIAIDAAMQDETVKKFGMQFEWLWAYASARGAGADSEAAAQAAYVEWDL